MDAVGSIRRASTPVDHLVAEMAATPLASVASLELALTQLVSDLPNRTVRHRYDARDPCQDTAELWRRAERELLQSFPAVSLDELIAIRDMLWFQHGSGSSPTVGDYLRDIAQMFLEAHGAMLVPTLPARHLGRTDSETSAESRRTLRWLTLAIPPDLLCAAAATGDDALELALTNPTVDRMLRAGGFAETHLHLGAALSFDTIWQGMVSVLGEPSFKEDALLSPGAELDEGRELGAWLVRAGIARILLAYYLQHVRNTAGGDPGEETFGDFLVDHERWRWMAPSSGVGDILVAKSAVDDLCHGQLSGDVAFGALQQVYRRLVPVPVRTVARSLADVSRFDPLASIFAVPPLRSPEQGQPRSTRTPEQRFVGRAMHFVEESPDDSFERTFWQVVRVRCLTYRHIVQRPMTPGLQWFIRFYSRARPGRRRFGRGVFLDSAAELSGRDRGLKSLEVRTSPDETLRENLGFARETASWTTRRLRVPRDLDDLSTFTRLGARAFLPEPTKEPDTEQDPLEVGIVFHFVKDRGGGTRDGLESAHWSGTNADPDLHPEDPRLAVNASGMRYTDFYLRQRASAIALARTLQRWPRSLYVVRGLDVCADELGVPSWVIRPLLQRVRAAAQLGGTALERLGHGPAPSLRTTAHAGEDFVHLTTGLRGVDEAIEHLGLREGDRIGHAVALGVDATTWARRIGRVAVPREVRMWDLLWEWTWIARYGGGVPRHTFIEREISRLTEEAFGRILRPYELELLRTDLLDPEQLWMVGWPHGDRPGDCGWSTRRSAGFGGRRELLHRYLADPVVFKKGRTVEWIDPTPEAAAMEYLQDGLRRKVGSLGLTVEINPTSNLLIGDLGSLTEHPMWRLDPPVADVDLPPVAICVGSDDPLMFASSLIEEYNVLYDGLLEGGLTDAAAREWLERVRRRGLESRFTCNARDIRPIEELPNPLRDNPLQVI